MRQVNVVYCGWGEQWPLGRLADDGRTLLFEYAPEALAQGLELSPLHLKLRPQAYGDFPVYQHRLPGLLADGGRLVIPLGSPEHQKLTLVTRTGDSFQQQAFDDVVFVPLKSGQE